MTYRTLGENIRAFRIAEGLTQIELGVSYEIITTVNERGGQNENY